MKKPAYISALLATLFALFTSLQAGAQSGNIVLGSDSMTAGEMISAIEGQTDYRFAYNKNVFDVSRTVSVKHRTISLQEAMESMTGGQSVKYVIHKNYIAIVPADQAPRPQVRREVALRTSDVYRRSDPNSDVGPVLRDPVPQDTTSPVEVVPPVLAKKFYSDYSPLNIPGTADGRLPRFALKTNLLYGIGTLTPNIAAEVALSPQWTLEAAYSSNPWNYKAKASGAASRKLLHGIVRIEGRYWLCERFNGHFVGVHGLYSEYNVSGRDIPLLFEKKYRYKGNAWGGGIVYGYDLPIGKSWNVEFTAGAGVYRMTYDRYSCLTCSTDRTPQTKTWFGPSRLGVSLEFLIK